MARLLQTNLDAAGVARIQNLPAPGSANEPARLIDLQSAVEGLNWKDNVRAFASANVTLASPGTTIDGVTMVVNDRFGAPLQTTTSEGGIYIYNGSAVPATRAPDMNVSSEFTNAIVAVDEGTVNSGTQWRQTAINVVVGTTAIAFTAFLPGAPAATTVTPGIAALATLTEVDAGVVTNKIVTPATLSTAANRKLKFSSNIGDSVATQIDVTHNLNTLDVQTYDRIVSTGAEIVCDVTALSVNVVRLNFLVAPGTSAYRAVILG